MREIVRRRVEFDFDPAAVPRAWYRGDVHLTTFWNALSLLFPEGERFFVESVRRYRDRIDDAGLRAQVDGFIGQEAMHGRGHRGFNDMLRDQGPGVAAEIDHVDAQLRRLLNLARRRASPRRQLAITCALEHFTAILAEQLLGDAAHRDATHESVRPLWVWHALEESEHRAVAFDVHEALGGGYARRVGIMLVTSAFFFGEVAYVYARLLRAQGELANARGWLGAVGYLWGRPGLLRKLVPAYLDYFRPDFHPEDRDTGSLLATWRERLFGETGELRGRLHEGTAA